jgi:hypothetical protein
VVQKYSIFVSSTAGFEEERAEIKRAMEPEYSVYSYDTDQAATSRIDIQLQEKLLDADVVVALVGERYGSGCRFPAPRQCRTLTAESGVCAFIGDPRGFSIVQWELAIACSQRLDVKPFLQASAAEEARDPRQSDFIDRLRKICICDEYRSVPDLVKSVRRAMGEWRYKHEWERLVETRADTRCCWVAVSAGIASAAFLLVILILLWTGSITKEAGIWVMGGLAMAIVACVLLLVSREWKKEKLNEY